MSFDPEILFDPSISDVILHEQLEAFLHLGYSGAQFIRLILTHQRRGMAFHTSRILETLTVLTQEEQE
jgi:hypothetical protein